MLQKLKGPAPEVKDLDLKSDPWDFSPASATFIRVTLGWGLDSGAG